LFTRLGNETYLAESAFFTPDSAKYVSTIVAAFAGTGID
jgi:hypothetical protein